MLVGVDDVVAEHLDQDVDDTVAARLLRVERHEERGQVALLDSERAEGVTRDADLHRTLAERGDHRAQVLERHRHLAVGLALGGELEPGLAQAVPPAHDGHGRAVELEPGVGVGRLVVDPAGATMGQVGGGEERVGVHLDAGHLVGPLAVGDLEHRRVLLVGHVDRGAAAGAGEHQLDLLRAEPPGEHGRARAGRHPSPGVEQAGRDELEAVALGLAGVEHHEVPLVERHPAAPAVPDEQGDLAERVVLVPTDGRTQPLGDVQPLVLVQLDQHLVLDAV